MSTEKTEYRFAVGVALAAALLLVWLSLGVVIIGQDGDPANLMYFRGAGRRNPRRPCRALSTP